MEIVTRQNYHDLLNYLPHIKYSLNEWKLVDIRLTAESEKYFTIARLSDLVHSLFKEKEGKIYICNMREIFLLIRWGQHNDPLLLSRKIEDRLSAVSYEIVVHEPTSEGLQRLEMLIRYEDSGTLSFNDTRFTRRENIFLVAADEKYMRMLVKTGIPNQITVKQVTDGNAVLEAYKKYVPDIVFLDIHLQGRNGIEILHDIINLDKDAYVVMLSPEGTLKNIDHETQTLAKGFVTIPFSQGKMMECLKKCPTLS